MTFLSEQDLASSPFDQFKLWFNDAKKSSLSLPEAFCLSTISETLLPEGRMLLLKGVDDSGFIFYTNFNSPKGKSLKKKPQAALTFYWESLRRQVRVTGLVQEVSSKDADEYFSSRARLSQIGAWASKQSQVVSSREELDKCFKEFETKFEGKEVPRPEYWSGFKLLPETVEFWQEQPNRMHDRFLYSKTGSSWKIERLFP